ncbi:hypothetical protein [Dechloromonas sp.]|uniref:hypothetical protein n=1 Tax=Dechloromonas sp. TaxID=1917218 RepID=UPI001227D7FC|nr:hypothetical protein [Dechloromonas sp.]MBU3696016.1 hypothetical protein [Dechloromonas sp.]TEX47069.1 MAG: hypothetical protein CFR70_10695 [Rhodocyclaceae bacterium]
MPSSILARADALMQRRRQSPGEIDDIPVLTDSVAPPDDDIPVLTDCAPHDEPPSPEPLAVDQMPLVSPDSSPPAPDLLGARPIPPPSPAEALPEQLLTELARRVEERLTAELPRLIESTLRDLLAEKAMIDALPPQD